MLLAAMAAALAGTTARAQTDQNQNDPPPGDPPPRAVHFGQVLKHILEQYDINKDGQLDQSEMAALQKDIDEGKIQPPGRGMGPGPGGLPREILEKYDVNKDGKLDENERAALRADIEAGKIQPPPRFGRGPRGLHGPGGPPPPPPSAQEILQKFDLDKDGKLDEAELTAFLKSMPRPPFGPPGAGGPPPDGAPQQR